MKHKRRSIADRFAEKVGPLIESGCREWRGTLINSGYGQLRVGGKREGKLLAHRIAWQLEHGDIPKGMFVLHKCDNKLCVNVEHLMLGTHLDNMLDCLSKGRTKKTQFNVDEVGRIFALRKSGAIMREIAEEFGVSRPLISLILNGKLKSVTLPHALLQNN